jgi:hypothetical protein
VGRADVGHRTEGTNHLRHPEVGELRLRHEKLDIVNTAGQQLLIFHAEPGSAAAQGLALLGSLVTPVAVEADVREPR